MATSGTPCTKITSSDSTKTLLAMTHHRRPGVSKQRLSKRKLSFAVKIKILGLRVSNTPFKMANPLRYWTECAGAKIHFRFRVTPGPHCLVSNHSRVHCDLSHLVRSHPATCHQSKRAREPVNPMAYCHKPDRCLG